MTDEGKPVVPGQRRFQRLGKLSKAFKPGTPVSSLDFFAGRSDQIIRLYDVLRQPGQHAALFGERGVGKTSLANIIGDAFQDHTKSIIHSFRVACDKVDTYQSLWAKIFNAMSEPTPEHEITTDVVFTTLSRRHDLPLIIIDELDRFDDNTGLSMLADTMKRIADDAIQTNIILVGVSRSLTELLGDHESLIRSLAQVPMPRMTRRELSKIIDLLAHAELSIEDSARDRITMLSEGLPYYTHLLSSEAGRRAIDDDRDLVTLQDVDAAVKAAVTKVEHSTLIQYKAATRSPKPKSIFAEVLAACALAEKDELGWFQPAAVREPLAAILKKSTVEFSSFSRHLREFTEEKRRNVLERAGEKWGFVFRFREPAFQAYVVHRSMADGLFTEQQLTQFRPEAPVVPDLPFGV